VFSREQLLDSVWGRDIYIDERTVDVHIGRLRKLLNLGREQDPIRTVRGAGYALDDRFARVAGYKFNPRNLGLPRLLRWLTAPIAGGLIGDARVMCAVRQTGQRLAAAEKEL